MFDRFIKRMFIVVVFALVVVSLGACARKPATSGADYIGIDAAKAAALKAADLSSDGVVFSSAGLDSRNGTFFYQVVFTENGVEHKYDIDALTGIVIAESHSPRIEDTPVDSNLVQKETTTEILDTTAELSQETSTAQQNTELPQKPTTTIATQESSSPQNTTSQQIDGTAAWSIALNHAGVLEENVAVHEIESDIEDGRRIFEIEFVTWDGVEYDYEISAVDGSIISFDYDAESVILPSVTPDSGIITETQAKQTVVDRVPGATTDLIRIHLDEDDGRLEYEGSLIYDRMKYEFKIDAYSGSVIEWEAELIH